MNPLSSLPKYSIGAWCYRPDADRIALARKLGLDSLHLMVHDDAADRRDNAWAMDRDVRTSCQRIIDAGLELHLTAWAQPYASYLAKGCDELVALVGDFGARSVCWDAEEPWTLAVGGLPPDKAAACINLYGARMGVTGIGYMSHELDPLLAKADYVCPQAYVTGATKGGLEVDGVDEVIARWAKRAPHAEIVPAFAAYAQLPADLGRCWRAAGSPRQCFLWSMKHIEHRPQIVERFVREVFGDAPLA